jgi:uncharacterized protein
MDKGTNKAIKEFILAVSGKTPVLTDAFLFGSYAKLEQKPDSDIDIALIFENLNENDKFDVQVNLLLLAAQFDSRIEPHPLSKNEFRSNSPFVHEILKNGKRLLIHNVGNL